MNWKISATGLLGMVTLGLAACGGSDSNEPTAREPFVEFRVNGQLNPETITVNRVHVEGEENYNPCDPDLFANAGDVQATYSDFCETEISLIQVNFFVRYYNAAFDTLPLTYTGNGFTVQIFEYDDGAPDNLGAEVWNSSYVEQTRVEVARDDGQTVDDFDPTAINSIDLGPGEGFPTDSVGTSAYSFAGDRNLRVGFESPAAFDPAGLVHEPDASVCDWTAVPTGDVAPDPIFEKVICRTQTLLPKPSVDADQTIRYVARVRFNFNDWSDADQPEDVLIVVEPPA